MSGSIWEDRTLAGDLAGLDPRADLARLRRLVETASAEDRDLRPLFFALRSLDPIALADLAVGPRAPAGERLIEAALTVVESLEAQVAPVGLYRRLVTLAGPRALEVLAVAAGRHPTAGWLVALAEAAREEPPGLIQLSGAPPVGFEKTCREHAAAGHRAALAAAATRGRPEALAALLAVGAVGEARTAAARYLEEPAAPDLAPWVAAVWGPEPDGFYAGVVCHLRTAAAADRLAAAAGEAPRTRALLTALGRALDR